MEIYYFIYETTNLINGKKYRGIHKTSNLDDGYLGSGIAFEKAIIKYGKQNFSREILEFCSSYDELIELEKLYVDDVWVRDHSNYNLKTGGQSAGILSEESKGKISETLKKKYANGEINIDFNFKPGHRTWNKGMKNIYKEETLNKIHESSKNRYDLNEDHPFKKNNVKGREPWNKGLKTGSQSDETKRKKSETLKERYKNQDHHSKGKEPWNKGKKGEQVAWNKGKKMKKYKCPHCEKETDISNGKRWHFDNCKLRPNV